jgi:hypothetical protein
MERYFLPGEQEEVSLWETQCVDPDPEALCNWAVVIAIAPPAMSYQSQISEEEEGEGEARWQLDLLLGPVCSTHTAPKFPSTPRSCNLIKFTFPLL